MISRPKYKIARRLGAPVFEKTQTQKYAQRAEKKLKSSPIVRSKTEFAMQHNEKQKARMVYGISEKQFANYVKSATEKKASRAVATIYENLELRLDNVAYRVGFASTRRAGRQMVSHGHLTVNGKKVTVPSYALRIGDVVGIREGSMGSKLFTTLDERIKNTTLPSWVTIDFAKKEVTIHALPKSEQADMMFNLNAVVEFYSR